MGYLVPDSFTQRKRKAPGGLRLAAALSVRAKMGQAHFTRAISSDSGGAEAGLAFGARAAAGEAFNFGGGAADARVRSSRRVCSP